MTFGTKTKKKEAGLIASLQQNIVPIYILISAAFIIYMIWLYISGVVYGSGVALGQQQGYEFAFQEIVNELTQSCDPVGLTLGETELGVINIDCLEMPQDDMMFDDDMIME